METTLQLRPIGTVSEMDGKYLTFWIDIQLFAMPIVDVVQIVQMQEIAAIPDYPLYAKGIINLRGSVIPVIDVRLRLGREEIPYSDHTCIIVAMIGDHSVGFLVDAIDEVASISDDMISPPPKTAKNIDNIFLSGIARLEDSVALLLDTRKMLNDVDLSVASENLNL